MERSHGAQLSPVGDSGGGLRQIALLGQSDRKSAPGRVAGDARPIDAATDDEQVDRGRNGGILVQRGLPPHRRRS